MVDENDEVKVFISYSHKDESHRGQLEDHLAILQRTGKISSWTDRKIVAGTDWAATIDANIQSADIILLLVSPSFVSSPYCMDRELAIALDRHQAEAATVIPIFVRPADLESAPFMSIQGLPNGGIPVTKWEDPDTAWLDVAKGIRAAAEKIAERKRRRTNAAAPTTLGEALSAYVERLDTRLQNGASVSGILTGLADFDRAIDGLQRGDLVTVASRPGMGKTNFCLGIAAAVAGAGLPTVYFSTKTSANDVVERLLANSARLHFSRLRSARMSDASFVRLRRARDRVACAQTLLGTVSEIAGTTADASGTSPTRSEVGRDLGTIIAAAMREAVELLAREWRDEYPEGAVEWLLLQPRDVRRAVERDGRDT
jgi:replicative DNA helicase